MRESHERPQARERGVALCGIAVLESALRRARGCPGRSNVPCNQELQVSHAALRNPPAAGATPARLTQPCI